jgi:hypothetical protein
MRRITGCLVPALCLALAACTGGTGWIKAGSEAADTERDYRECRDAAASAVSTQVDIDQDIAATRASDVQRSEIMQQQARTTRELTSDRAAAIVATCMHAKGFVPVR